MKGKEFSFSVAISKLKDGQSVARKGWNGKGMSLRMYNPYFDSEFTIVGHEGGPTLAPWIGIKNVQNEFVPWQPSQSDMLAEDWLLIE